jgi:hypothetical protein
MEVIDLAEKKTIWHLQYVLGHAKKYKPFAQYGLYLSKAYGIWPNMYHNLPEKN